jgi:hypothetical protein
MFKSMLITVDIFKNRTGSGLLAILRLALMGVLLFILCNISFAQDKKIEKWVIEALPVNSSYDEFGVTYKGEEIVFCSNRKSDVFVHYSDANGKPLFHLYRSELKADGKWKDAHPFAEEIASNFDEGPASFNKEGTEVYFSRHIRTNKKIGSTVDSTNTMSICKSSFNGSEWGQPEVLTFCNEQFNYLHPSLSLDGKRLFFSSNMDGGYGGYDLYVSTLENGQWSLPVNLGSNVNTDGNEVFPFIHSSGILYFSSNKHETTGGLDIFSTFEKDGEWQPVYHLESPINSRYDDFSFITTKTAEEGYFASNRNRSNDDIYSFKMNFPDFESCDTAQVLGLCYVFSETSAAGIDTTSLRYEWDLGDGTKIRNIEAEHCFKDTGTYIVRLNVVDTLTGIVMKNQATYEMAIYYAEQAIIDAVETCKMNTNVTFAANLGHLKGFSDCQYFWEFSDGKRQTGATVKRTFRRPGVYTVKLGITTIDSVTGELKKSCVYRGITVTR